MASINSFADVLRDWEALLAALDTHPELLSLLAADAQALQKDLADVRVLKSQQEVQKAGAQALTQQINTVVAHGKDIAMKIRTMAKGVVGLRNEAVVLFKVAPIRKRGRRAAKPAEEPEAKEPTS